MRNANNAQIKDRAAKLADFITSNTSANIGSIDLLEELFILNHNDFEGGFEHWNEYKNFINEIAFLLSNPEISSRLDKYNQENAARMLKGLVGFFTTLMDSQVIQDYLLSYALRHCSGELSEATISNIEEAYLKND